MACPHCGTEIRPGQKFCAECGQALSSSCAECGTPYEGLPKFCAECGATIVAPSAGGESATRLVPAGGSAEPRTAPAERRLVTILFADLVGFTQLSEQHDPEEVRELLSRYFDSAREVIEGYGGSV